MHPSPDAIALLALGEDPGSEGEREHVDTCSVCTAQIEELARVVELGRLSDESDGLQTPSPAVWQRIRAELFETPPLTTLAASTESVAPADAAAASVPVDQPSAPGRGARRARSLFALVAAVALIAGLGLGFGIARLSSAPDGTAAIHLNGLPSWPGAEGEARVAENDQGQRVLVVQVTTPRPIDGHLEVWLSDDKALHMVDMGTMETGSGTFVIPPEMQLVDSPVIDVSLEPRNDTDPEHSKDSVVRGRLRV